MALECADPECADPELPQYRKGTDVHRNVLYRYQWCDKVIFGNTLDIPCGLGWGTSLITRASCVIGVDRNPKFVEIARKRYPKLLFEQGDMLQLPLDDCQFDSVVCCEGIEHIAAEDTKKAMIEIHRVLCDDGIFVGSIPLGDGGKSPNPYHLTTWTVEQIQQLFAECSFQLLGGCIKYNMYLFNSRSRPIV